MKSQIPRPDEAIAELVEVNGQKRWLPNKTWYRWFTNFATDAAATEITANANQANPPPNLTPLQNDLADTRKIAVMAEQSDSRSWVDALTRRVKILEALVFGERKANTAASIGAVSSTLTNTHIFVGNSSNVATDVAMSGDVTITNSGSTAIKRIAQILVTDPNGSALTTGDGKAYIRINSLLNGFDLTAVAAHVTTVSSSGTPTIQIANVTQSADMLSTKLTIDESEKDSKDATTPAVIDTGNDDVATGDELRIDIDVAGTGAKGLIVELTFTKP